MRIPTLKGMLEEKIFQEKDKRMIQVLEQSDEANVTGPRKWKASLRRHSLRVWNLAE